MSEYGVQCQAVTVCTESGDDTDSDVRKIGVATKRFPAVHIGQVRFDKRNASALKRVSQGDTGVGITCRIDDNKITLDSKFIDDLGADSLDTVELVMAFEEQFGIEIPDDAAETILTVQNAVDFIDNKK